MANKSFYDFSAETGNIEPVGSSPPIDASLLVHGEWAYRVTPRPTNLTGHVTRALSDVQLLQLIGEPQPGTPMIGWKKQLSESQLSQLVAFVRYLGNNAQLEIHH